MEECVRMMSPGDVSDVLGAVCVCVHTPVWEWESRVNPPNRSHTSALRALKSAGCDDVI